MRLRQTIRAPSRYEDECELSPGVSPRRLPRRRKAAAAAEEERAIAYIAYNPNQPPAAFPTLDHPLPAGQTYHSLTTTTSTSAAAAAASANPATGDADLEADGHHLDAFDSLYRGIPPAELDNFIASNGPQNPQYKRNMALLAREDDGLDLETSDNDDEQKPLGNEAVGEQWIHSEESIPKDPQWSDISLSLQIEIAENMLETHRLSTIQLLLGLNECDIVQLTRNLNMQSVDLEYENRVLEEMRNKQVQALMCLDNSDLKQHSVPARLVMSRKVWNQCHRLIRKQSKMRYLLCQAGDLLLARRFLSKRGLPKKYAGEWDNQFVATPSISNTAGVSETLQWRPAAEPHSDSFATAGNIELLPGHPLHSATGTQTGVQDASPATVNGPPVVQLPSTQLYDPMPQAGTQQASNKRTQPLLLPSQALVRLKIGPRNAARIHIDRPATPSRRHMDILLATPRPQAREPNSDDTIEEFPSVLNGLDGMHHQYPMPVRRRFGSWSTGLSRFQPLEPSFPTKPLTGSFSDIVYPRLSVAKPKARQFDQAERINMHERFAPDTAPSISLSPPQPSNLPAMEGVVYGSAREFTLKNAIQTPEPSSPNCTTTTKLTANDNHYLLPKTNVEMYLATPMSYRVALNERQMQSSISAYQDSPPPLGYDAETGELGSASTSYPGPDAAAGHIEPKQTQRAAQSDADVFSPSKAMQGLNLIPSISLRSIETAKGQSAEDSSLVGHQPTPGINTMQQPSKPNTYTNPLFGLDRFEIRADNEQATQGVNSSESGQPSSVQEQPLADAIGTSSGESSVMADMSKTEAGGPPSTNVKKVNPDHESVQNIPGNHLSPISANVAVDIPPSTRKTRQSANKQTTGSKRDASTEMKAEQPKRGRNSNPTTNPPVTRGRGRPRKHPVQ